MVSPLKRQTAEVQISAENLDFFQVFSGGYFVDTEPPPITWLIPGLILDATPAVFVSKGGLGKTWMTLQMGVAMALGEPFQDFPAQEPRAFVYFGLEDSKAVIHRRLRTIIRKYREAGKWTEEADRLFEANFHAVLLDWTVPGVTGYLPELMPRLESLMTILTQKGCRPGLVVLDTLARFSKGDENTAEAMRPIQEAVFRIGSYGYASILNHHTSKGQDGARSKDKPSLTDRMDPEWVRGSSAISSNSRCVLQMTSIRPDEAELAGLDPDKAREGGYAVFGATKLNGGEKAPWRFIEQDEAGRWGARDDGAEIIARIMGSKAVAKLNKSMAVLADLFHATTRGMEPDLDSLAEKHYPAAEYKNPRNSLKVALNGLRKSGLVQKNSLLLTVQGLEKARLCRGSRA